MRRPPATPKPTQTSCQKRGRIRARNSTQLINKNIQNKIPQPLPTGRSRMGNVELWKCYTPGLRSPCFTQTGPSDEQRERIAELLLTKRREEGLFADKALLQKTQNRGNSRGEETAPPAPQALWKGSAEDNRRSRRGCTDLGPHLSPRGSRGVSARRRSFPLPGTVLRSLGRGGKRCRKGFFRAISAEAFSRTGLDIRE